MSIPLTDFVKSAPTFSGKSFGKNSSKEIGVDSLIETGKCDLLIQNKDNNLARGIKIMFFSCPEQLNRCPCHSLTDSLTQLLFLLPYKKQS